MNQKRFHKEIYAEYRDENLIDNNVSQRFWLISEGKTNSLQFSIHPAFESAIGSKFAPTGSVQCSSLQIGLFEFHFFRTSLKVVHQVFFDCPFFKNILPSLDCQCVSTFLPFQCMTSHSNFSLSYDF